MFWIYWQIYFLWQITNFLIVTLLHSKALTALLNLVSYIFLLVAEIYYMFVHCGMLSYIPSSDPIYYMFSSFWGTYHLRPYLRPLNIWFSPCHTYWTLSDRLLTPALHISLADSKHILIGLYPTLCKYNIPVYHSKHIKTYRYTYTYSVLYKYIYQQPFAEKVSLYSTL